MWESIENFLVSPMALELIAAIVAGVWLKIKQSESKAAKIAQIIDDAIGSGVTSVYHSYVKELKVASSDGRLTEEESTHARRAAGRKAMDFAKRRGIELAHHLEPEHLDWLIEKVVTAMKGPNNVQG